MVSPDEVDTFLGLAAGYTEMPDASWAKLKIEPRSLEATLKRRNAVGNALALPVMRRLICGPVLSVTQACLECVWDSPDLQHPIHQDAASDVFEKAGDAARRFSWLTAPFDKYSQ